MTPRGDECSAGVDREYHRGLRCDQGTCGTRL